MKETLGRITARLEHEVHRERQGQEVILQQAKV